MAECQSAGAIQHECNCCCQHVELSMESRLQRRVQRYGWDLASADYEPLWQMQLACLHDELVARASLVPGEHVLDVACGSGLVAFRAAEAVGPYGKVVGIDVSGHMLDAARRRAEERRVRNASFERMDAEDLQLPDASFNVVLCALGLMYMPEPEQALREMRRVLRPGGRMLVAVWGERSRCGWSALFPIVDAEVASDVCPWFFRLGQGDTLARVCADAQFAAIGLHRMATTLDYANADEACRAAFVGGPVSLAWSRFDNVVRARVCARYVEAIADWRHGRAYRVPGEFVIVAAAVPRDG
jgi:SAM-dependent methyltransferase